MQVIFITLDTALDSGNNCLSSLPAQQSFLAEALEQIKSYLLSLSLACKMIHQMVGEEAERIRASRVDLFQFKATRQRYRMYFQPAVTV